MSRRSNTGTFRASRLIVGTDGGSNVLGVLDRARGMRATDVHIMAHAPIFFRVDGELAAMSEEKLTASMARHLSCALLSERQIAALDEHLDVDFMYTDPRQQRYRVNVGFFNGATGATIRILPNAPIPLEDLRLPPIVEEMTRRTKGLVLITGSTSQGKTTTLASMVDAINRHSRKHIVTIEDPIEYLHLNGKSLVRQREVGRDTESFAKGLRAALRQDPDVLLIGEIRDYDTIETALRAAESGVLVLSTMHIVSIEKLMDKLLAFVPNGRENMIRTMTAEALLCVIHQELLPTIDGGKRVACEVLVATRAVRNQIRSDTVLQLRSSVLAGREHGMQTMSQSLDALLAEGHITEGQYQDVMKNYATFT